MCNDYGDADDSNVSSDEDINDTDIRVNTKTGQFFVRSKWGGFDEITPEAFLRRVMPVVKKAKHQGTLERHQENARKNREARHARDREYNKARDRSVREQLDAALAGCGGDIGVLQNWVFTEYPKDSADRISVIIGKIQSGKEKLVDGKIRLA